MQSFQHSLYLFVPKKKKKILSISCTRLPNPMASQMRFSNQLNVAFIDARYHFVQERRTPVSRHANYAFIVSSLLELLQLKCQGQADSPFVTHPRTIRFATTSLLVYGLAHDAQLRFPRARLPPGYASVVGHAVRFVGSVSVAALASVLVPDSAQPLLYVVYVLPSAGEFVHWFKRRFIDEVEESYGWSGTVRRMIGSWRVRDDRYTLPVFTNYG